MGIIENSKTTHVADRITELSASKRKLLAKLLAQQQSQTQLQGIPKRDINAEPVLSFAQERLWFLDQLFPDSIMYNIAGTNRVIGPLNEAVVIDSFNEIVRRHETLRTTFKTENGRPVPIVHQHLTLTPRLIDLQHLPEDVREIQAKQHIMTEVKEPFNLTTGPLLRLTLLRLAEEEFIGLLTMHHIAADGVSTKVLFQEFGAIYQAFLTGKPSPLPELPVQYSDFAIWQRQRLQGDRLQSQLTYWKNLFGNQIPTLHLPTDHPHPANPTFGGARQPIIVPTAVTDKLKELSQKEQATLFMVLLAAFKTLLYRYTEQTDIIVGVPIAGRNRSEVANLIGCFLNMLALRTDLSGMPTFRELIHRVRKQAMDAYAHQDLPFEKLVEELQPERTATHAPITQVAFSFEENPVSTFSIEGLTMYFEEIESETSKLDLALELVEEMAPNGRSQLTGWFEYNTDIYEAETVSRIAGHFNALLESIVTNPDVNISHIPILPKSESDTLLTTWNDTDAPYPLAVTLHQEFEKQVTRTPNNLAVVCGEQTLTYRELNECANQVAHYLRKQGVGAESMVGICMDRSIEMIVGVWGILKAGAAYVPIDAQHPESRLSFVLSDSQGKTLLTQKHLVDRIPQGIAQIVCLDSDWEIIAQECKENLINLTQPKNLAYVLYTAGSTGAPKGVTVPHLDVVHHTWAFIEMQEMTADDRMLMFVSLIFDAAAAALYPPLFCGASVILPPIASSKLSANELTEFCAENKITVTHLPAAFWHQWVDDLENSRQAHTIPLRIIMTGGETPNIDKLRTWSRLFNRRMTFFNAYGPTEAVITITLQKLSCDIAALKTIKKIPAGRPIPNKKIYLLDTHLNLVPIGVPGEVYVGHIGLARNYFNQPRNTAEKFVPDPFSQTPGSFLYRTGDMARYLPDGTLDFIGRIDQQVKVRGFRIELGGIEATLAQHPNVLEVVAVVRSDFTGNNQLVAYIVPRTEPAPTPKELHDFASDHLPDYMLPQLFIIVEHIPLTNLGKADLSALPDPDWSHIDRIKTYVAPRTAVEHSMAEIWANILHIEQVSVFDNFFDLGGHSLLATQVVAHIRETLGVNMPMRYLFEMPTIASLAIEVVKLKAEQEGAQNQTIATLHTITPDLENRYEPFPLNEVQQAYWIGRGDLLELGNVACHGYVEVDGIGMDLSGLNDAWQKLIERHDMLRAVIRPDGQQQILREVPYYAIKVIDLSDEDETAVHHQLQTIRKEMSHQVISCTEWPLFELRAAKIDAHRTRIFASVDLLIADAWSFYILLQELHTLFENPSVALPVIDLSFRDYIMAERALEETEAYQQALTYWQKRLPTLPPGPELPLAKNPQAVIQPHFTRRQARLEADMWQDLKKRAAKAGLTPSGVLLAAYAEVLNAWSKTSHFTLTLTLFNRLPMHPQVNNIFGDFTSITLLEVDNQGQDSFEVRARRIQEQLWQDMDYRQVSGIRVQRELMRQKGGASKSMMPVVFTSTLTQDGSDARSSLAWLGELVYAIGQTPQVWLDHVVAEEAGALVFNWDSVDELFPDDLLADMFTTYCDFLERLATDESTWHGLSRHLISDAQLAPRITANETTAPISDELLHTLFMKQAAATPEATAVITPHHRISYHELYSHANQIGRFLRDQHVLPNQLVAIVMQKGWEQIAAALGILHAGAAYLPIDAAMPKERIWHLLEHGQVQVALTQGIFKDSLEWPDTVQCLTVDDPVILSQSTTPLPVVQKPTDLAYVIYTSGSTGLPKGVAIDHRGVVNTILDINHRFNVTASDKVLALSALNFDLSVYDIFGLLAVGGSVVMPAAASRREPSHWVTLLAQEKITLWNTVPALMGMLVEYLTGLGKHLSPSLRLVMMSGDWIPLPLPNQIRALTVRDNIDIYSLGGATEASIWSILYPIHDVNPEWKSIPYGKPMVNQTFHVLDENLDPCPTWVPGQLYIGGIGVALGYWHDEEKTNNSFIIHPRTSERLYRTGDLGRYLPNGNIEFLGREDFQVKVQGYRIELGEIEAALLGYPGIAQVVVTAVGDRTEDKRLIGYIVMEEDGTVDVEAIKEFLRKKLPVYMIPSMCIFLDELPLTINGKINRKGLPNPNVETGQVEDNFVAPRNQVEEQLAALTTHILNLPRVSIYDNFFELGGNSIHATQLITNIRETFAIELPLRSIFEASSVAALSERIVAFQWTQKSHDSVEDEAEMFEEGVL